MAKPFRIGIVGCASSYTFIYADALREQSSPDLEFVGVTSLDRSPQYLKDSLSLPWLAKVPETAEEYAQVYGVPVYATFEELLEQGRPDGVCICTEDYLHLHYTLQALEAGLHVYVPKPFATQHQEAVQMFDEARKRGKVLLVSLPWRYHPAYVKANQLIEQGAIGQPLSGHFCIEHHLTLGGWKSDPAMAAGPEYEMGFYTFDVMRWLMKSEPRRVMAYGANLDHKGIPYIDNAVCLVEYENGAMSTADLRFSADFRHPDPQPLDMIGSEGALTWQTGPNSPDQPILIYTKEGLQRHTPDPLFNYKGAEMLHWAASARTGEDVSARQQDALRVLDFINAFKQAYQGGAPVELK